ncbi:MAG: single-stranded-DNA-specific exonuclease RecJ [Bacteroidetes bacterium]|nr:single-stranded-DNA-specific exonuclease RecJ [Bacteroidota bacterium]
MTRNKRWVVKEIDTALARTLQDELKLNPVLARLLVQRNIRTFEEARIFFRPSLDHLHDPFLMKDMDKAVDRINAAMMHNEKIVIYGDYDVDGTTSVALMYSFLKKHYPNIDYYIPDRYKEGYGISQAGIDWAKQQQCSLIIALDCGIKSIDKIAYATSIGIDFIICDHHLPGDEIPAAVAVLDPKRTDCTYPYKELSGCGIGFKLLQAYCNSHRISFDELTPYLDLVVVSIASDIVPITGENRTLAFFGLKQLNESPREGLKALLETAVSRKEISVSDIVFIIGPRINAAGRIDDAKNAVRLLLSETQFTAGSNAELLNQKNTERRQFDMDITKEALAILQDDIYDQRKSTVIYREHWHKGVIGIVASRLTEVHYKPTIVLTQSNGVAAGSARSIAGFDIYSAIKECGDLLEQFGGHMYAAGLTLKLENVDKFIKRFEEVVSTTIDENLLTPEIVVDDEIQLKDITPSFYNILKQFAPFGPGNMKPVFVTRNLTDTGYSRVVGNDHLKISLKDKDNYSGNGIAFGMAHFEELVRDEPVDIVYTIEENEWRNVVRIDLMIKDIKPSNA